MHRTFWKSLSSWTLVNINKETSWILRISSFHCLPLRHTTQGQLPYTILVENVQSFFFFKLPQDWLSLRPALDATANHSVPVRVWKKRGFSCLSVNPNHLNYILLLLLTLPGRCKDTEKDWFLAIEWNEGASVLLPSAWATLALDLVLRNGPSFTITVSEFLLF